MGFFDKIFSREQKPGKPREIGESEFESEVLGAKKPVVVYFSSPTCGPCQVMSGLINEIGPEYSEKLPIFKVRVDQNEKLTMNLGLRSVPTLIFFDKGKPVDLVVGMLPLIPLKEKFDSFLKNYHS